MKIKEFFTALKAKRKDINGKDAAAALKAACREAGYVRFLAFWVVFLAWTLAAALTWFYFFLKDYQKVFEETRPILYQNQVMELFYKKDAARILEAAKPVALGPFEDEKIFADFLNDYLFEKEIAFAPKKGEHIEERPVYVVTADDVPFAVVRLKKQEETASYGLPLWETGSIEILPGETRHYYLLAPDTVEVAANGIAVTREALLEGGIRGTAEKYMDGYVQIPSYGKYDLGELHGAPMLSAINAAHEMVDITFDEKQLCYKAEFGGDHALQDDVEELVLQMAVDYAMYASNDLPNDAMDKYFPPKSVYVKGLKSGSRFDFNQHAKPEITKQEIREFIAYSQDAFFARVYVEQQMYVPFSGKTATVDTNLSAYYAKIDGEWKVVGIFF